MVTYKIDLDITPGGIPKIVHVKQYQTDATLEFKLHTRRGTLNVGNWTDCSVRGTKTDGNGYSASATFTVSSSTVTVDLTEQMTAVAGRQPYEITLTDESGKMITATFYLDVQRSALDGDTISASDIREITNALDHTDEILAAFDAATYDDIPTTNSNHAVKSGGIKTYVDSSITNSIASYNQTVEAALNTKADADTTDAAITELQDTVVNFPNISEYEWHLGVISGGKEVASSNRIISNVIFVGSIKNITVTGAADCLDVYEFGENDTVINDSGWVSSYTVSNNAVYIRIVIRKSSSNSSISESEIPTVYNRCEIEYVVPKSTYLVDENVKNLLYKKLNLPDISDLNWRLGVISGGKEVASPKRIVSDPIRADSVKKITMTGDSNCLNVYEFDETENVILDTSWVTTHTVSSDAAFIRIVLRKLSSSNPDISQSEIPNIYNRCEIDFVIPENVYTVYEHYENVLDKLNAPNISDLNWRLGVISGGKEVTSPKRIISDPIRASSVKSVTVTGATGCLNVYGFDEHNRLVLDSGWVTTHTVSSDAAFIRIVLRKSTSNQNISSSDIPTVYERCRIEFVIPEETYIYELEENQHDDDRAVLTALMVHATSSTFSPTKNDLTALWVTDIHDEVNRTKRMVKLLNSWGSDFFDVCINTGDTVYTLYTHGLEWYDPIIEESNIPVLNTVGNHDTWLSLQTLEQTDKKNVYDMVIAPVAEQTTIVQPYDAATLGYNYYYKDINGIRIIVLDCMYWDETQLAWFSNTLNNAKSSGPSGYPVIVCTHYPFYSTYRTIIDSVWNVGDTNRGNASMSMDISAAEAVQTFINYGGEFVCWLQGHSHLDRVYTLAGYGTQLCLQATSFTNRETETVKSDDETLYSYDALTAVTVDTTDKLLKIYRIGADVSRYGQKHKCFVWNYSTKRTVCEW